MIKDISSLYFLFGIFILYQIFLCQSLSLTQPFQKKVINLSNINPNYIVKPIISGSGNNTSFVKDADVNLLKEIAEEQDNGIMVQPFEKKISEGEFAIIFIDGINTHNMIRYPGIFYEKKTPIQVDNIPKKVLELAYKVKEIPEYEKVLYMRVDIVDATSPRIMEVELAEPDLLTRNIDTKEPIKILCEGIIKRISKKE